METMESAELGFGSVEACQMEIGITCEECVWHDPCVGNVGIDEYYDDLDDQVVVQSFSGVCKNCGNDYDVDVLQGESPVLGDDCPNCGCEIVWKEWR